MFADQIIAVYDKEKNRIWKFHYDESLETGSQIGNSSIFMEEDRANFLDYTMDSNEIELELEYVDTLNLNNYKSNCITDQKMFLEKIGIFGFLIDEQTDDDQENKFKRRSNSTDERVGKPLHCLIENKGSCLEFINFNGLECIRIANEDKLNNYYYYKTIDRIEFYGYDENKPKYDGIPKFQKESSKNVNLLLIILLLFSLIIGFIYIRKYRQNEKLIKHLDSELS